MSGRREDELVAGVHPVRHALAQAPERALELWLQDGAAGDGLAAIAQAARQAGVAIQVVPRRTLDRLAGDVRHQGVLLRQRAPSGGADLEALLEGVADPLLLVLDGVQDPHNLGACLRTANAAGALAIVAPLHRGTGLTATVRKAACGAAERTPLVQVRNLARALADLKDRGIRLVGAADDAPQDLYAARLDGPLALVLGAEDQGLRRLTRESCDELVGIPMRGSVESLNVSVAAAVCLYEAVRQRGPGPERPGELRRNPRVK